MSKTILITGSTDGIGKLTAIELGMMGHTVFIHGRSETKVNAVVSEITTKTNNSRVKGFVADFSDLNEVRGLANRIKSEVSAIDVLINNAGVFKSTIAKNNDGLDLRMVVNYLAPYLFTQILLPVIKKGKYPRIINLSSAAQAPVSKTVLLGEDSVSESESYAQSKLALTMWSMHLADKHIDIVVIPVNPGSLLNTKMVSEAYGHHWSSASKGVRVLVDLALNETHQRHSGMYFDNDKGEDIGVFSDAHNDAYNKKKIIALIEQTEKILK